MATWIPSVRRRQRRSWSIHWLRGELGLLGKSCDGGGGKGECEMTDRGNEDTTDRGATDAARDGGGDEDEDEGKNKGGEHDGDGDEDTDGGGEVV